MSTVACGGSQKRALGPLKMELLAIVSYLTWLLRIEFKSSSYYLLRPHQYQ